MKAQESCAFVSELDFDEGFSNILSFCRRSRRIRTINSDCGIRNPSSATRASRFSEPTSASTLAHFRSSRSCSVWASSSVSSAISARLVLVEFDPCETALVVNRHSHAVLDRAANVVDVDVVAEYGGRTLVFFLDRRAGEADE
jgi:hypothetical protein